MSTISRLLSESKTKAKQLRDFVFESGDKIKGYVDENRGDWQETAEDTARQAADAASEAVRGGSDQIIRQAKSMYVDIVYSEQKVEKLQHDVENQGARYRELLRDRRLTDIIFVGSESLATLLAASSVAPEIEAAYEAAYPGLAEDMSFTDKASLLNDDQLPGFVSAIKGKLFEREYVGYLNDGALPDGYVATLAESPNQPGWDIAIVGPHEEIVRTLQAKATDSVNYVVDAIEKYPTIDVVTTDEVYSHLVMSGISEGIASSGFSNAELTEQVEMAVEATDLEFDWLPPVFTLAFIAFTSYSDASLTLYEKARSFGDRSGKTYFAYLIGGGIAAITNTWWLGVLGSVSSRYMSDSGQKKVDLLEVLERTYSTNQVILNRLKALPKRL